MGITAADAIKEAKLTSNDLNDPVNGSDFKISGTAIDIMTPHLFEQLPYQTAARQISLAQKAAGNEFSFLIDHYSPQEERAPWVCSRDHERRQCVTFTLSYLVARLRLMYGQLKRLRLLRTYRPANMRS